jgi:hypothetical protein
MTIHLFELHAGRFEPRLARYRGHGAVSLAAGVPEPALAVPAPAVAPRRAGFETTAS